MELGELVTHLDSDLARTFRELLEQTVAEAGDFGLAVHDRIEHHPEPCCDLGSKHGLVEVAEGLLMLLQRQRIQRQPTPVSGLNLRGDHHMPAAFVRKNAKDYGTAKLAEGPAIDGRRLLVVEDVVTTGGQVVLSTKDLRARGATVSTALCVIDREQGGRANLAAESIELRAAFTRSDIDR